MRYLLLLSFFLSSLMCYSQADSIKAIEPGMETSFENYELLIIAIVGLLLLIGLRFWFRRNRKK